MVVMDEGDSSGAGAILEAIQRAHVLWLSDPRQEQGNGNWKLWKNSAAKMCSSSFPETIRLSIDLANN
jgi:hypothetical protein